VLQLTAEERELARDIEAITRKLGASRACIRPVSH
jgi:hypothetical protein